MLNCWNQRVSTEHSFLFSFHHLKEFASLEINVWPKNLRKDRIPEIMLVILPSCFCSVLAVHKGVKWLHLLHLNNSPVGWCTWLKQVFLGPICFWCAVYRQGGLWGWNVEGSQSKNLWTFVCSSCEPKVNLIYVVIVLYKQPQRHKYIYSGPRKAMLTYHVSLPLKLNMLASNWAEIGANIF